MIKSITNFLIIFFIFQQLKSQISQIDQNGVKPFCDETLHIYLQLSIYLPNLYIYLSIYSSVNSSIFLYFFISIYVYLSSTLIYFLYLSISLYIVIYCISLLFLCTVISRFWTKCGNSRVVNFAIFLMLSLL